MSFKALVSLLIFSLGDLSVAESGVLRSPTINVLLSICLFFFLKIFYLFDRDRDSQQEREHKQGEWERKKQAHSRRA